MTFTNETKYQAKGRRPKKEIADFQTYAQIGVGGSGKNLIYKINLIGTKYLWEGGRQHFFQFSIEKFSIFSAF